MSRLQGTIDYTFLATVATLTVFGFIMLISASAPSGYEQFGDSYYFVKHQFIFGIIPGLAGLLVFSKVSYLFWKRHAWTLLLLSIGLLVLVFLPGLSAGIGSAHSWIRVGGAFTLQPSEIVKLMFLFYLAAWLCSRSQGGPSEVNRNFAPFAGVLGAILLLMILQPDVGTMLVIAGMALVVYFVAGAPWSHILGLCAAGLGGLALLIGLAPYRAARFTTFLHPELDPQGIGYHVNQALLAIGSGGFFGLGYGHSRQKFQYLPEVVGDSMFAVVAEELGFFVSILLVGLFLYLVGRMLKIASEAPDPFAKYVVLGIAAWIIIQTFMNIGSMLSLLPITGVPLPFVSYGGTSMAVLLCAIGVVLNISKNAKT